MSYTYQTDHKTPDFVDITDPMNPVHMTYAQVQDLAPQWKPYPTDWRHRDMEEALDLLPEFANIRRLYRGDYPTLFWYQADGGLTDITLDGVTGRYVQSYIVRNKDAGEMVAVNQMVFSILRSWRNEKQGLESADINGFYFDATDQTVNASLSLKGFLESQGDVDAKITWLGTIDPVTQYPRNKLAGIADLQAINLESERMRQWGVDAEAETFQEQLDRLAVDVEETFADETALRAFFDDLYDTKKGV